MALLVNRAKQNDTYYIRIQCTSTYDGLNVNIMGILFLDKNNFRLRIPFNGEKHIRFSFIYNRIIDGQDILLVCHHKMIDFLTSPQLIINQTLDPSTGEIIGINETIPPFCLFEEITIVDI